MSYPKTAAEWWSMLDASKGVLRNLVVDWHPRSTTYQNAHGMEITAGRAEGVCEVVRGEEVGKGPVDAGAVFDLALERRDRDKMSGLLSSTWWGLPESTEVRSLPGFGLLCDLCSEAFLLYEEDPVVDLEGE